MSKFVLALDQGTTSSRAILFDHSGHAVSMAQREFPQITPQAAHVEHDPEAIWDSQLAVAREAIANAEIQANQIAALGVTNQRETAVVWEKANGKPIANAIVWQSRITANICDQLRRDGYEQLVTERTGLLIDPYFSATKIRYLLDQAQAQSRAEAGELLFGTIDSFLIWRLTGGAVHTTDYSNASRTMLYNIHTLDWDDELLKALNIPRAMLPSVGPSSHVMGETTEEMFGHKIPIAGIAGDQQAATFGQACFERGDAKNTYGTGCFLLMNTGDQPVPSQHRLLTTIGWGIDGKITYCLEGAVFIAGAVVQWLRDKLCIIESASDVERLAASVDDDGGVVFVPAFVGMGAPYWDADARGMIIGISRNTTSGHLARAAVDAMAYQTRDLLEAMQADSGVQLKALKVDGGAAANNRLLQWQADLLDVDVHRPVVQETTALGAAYLAGLGVGYWDDMQDVVANWALDRAFTPALDQATRAAKYGRWKRAVQRALAWEQEA